MGADKAGLVLAGRSLLERAVEGLRPLTTRVVLACGPRPRYAELGLELVLDAPGPAGARPGPVAGILAALDGIDSERFLVLACDMPRVDAALLDELLERAERDDLDACIFESGRGLEPLCAVYHRRCRASMRAALAAGERRVVAFLDRAAADGRALRVGRVREDELAHDLRGRDCALNLNTPEELARERGLWEEGRLH